MDIYLDENHDWDLDGQDLRMTTPQEDVVQRLSIKLQFLLGEWFLDITKGLPYTQDFFEQQTTLSDIYEIFRIAIKETEGVEELVDLSITPTESDKTLRVDFEVRDQFSTQSSSIEVSI